MQRGDDILVIREAFRQVLVAAEMPDSKLRAFGLDFVQGTDSFLRWVRFLELQPIQSLQNGETAVNELQDRPQESFKIINAQ